MKKLALTFFVSVQITYVYTLNLPGLFRCQISDSACLSSLTQVLVQTFFDGVPSLGIKSLDPMEFDYVRVDQDDLTFELRDVTIRGFKDLVMDEFRVNLKKSVSHSILRSDILVTGRYNVNGTVLFSPICGDGDISFLAKNLVFEIFDSIYLVKDKNGVDFLKQNKFFFNFDVKELAEFQLTDLFNGDKELSDEMHELINTNWRFLVQQFGKPLVSVVVDRMLSTIYKVFDFVPLNFFVTY